MVGKKIISLWTIVKIKPIMFGLPPCKNGSLSLKKVVSSVPLWNFHNKLHNRFTVFLNPKKSVITKAKIKVSMKYLQLNQPQIQTGRKKNSKYVANKTFFSIFRAAQWIFWARTFVDMILATKISKVSRPNNWCHPSMEIQLEFFNRVFPHYKYFFMLSFAT